MTTLTFLLRYWIARLFGNKNRARGLLAGRSRRLGVESKRLCAASLTANDVPHELSGVASVAEPKACATEQDCTQMPWCRINDACQRALSKDMGIPLSEAQK